ncbi:MAG: hypothetical protein WAV28_15795, partial [Sedimentisphaerales bacterium]
MLSTNKTQPKFDDTPKKLKVLTTNKVRIKTEAEMAAAAKAQIEALRPHVQPRETHTYGGPMLTTANMGDRVLNEKRKALMAKVKAVKRSAVQTPAKPEKKR